MKISITSLVAAASLLAGMEATQGQVLVPFDQQPSVRGNPPDADQRMEAGFFLQSAFTDNKIEILKGDLAATRASDQSVKDLAHTLVTDHKAFSGKLNGLASKKDVMLSKDLSVKQQEQIDGLAALSGTAFDKAYLADQKMAHTNSIALFERASTHGTDADVKVFAETSLPMLRKHLDMVRECADKYGMVATAEINATSSPAK